MKTRLSFFLLSGLALWPVLARAQETPLPEAPVPLPEDAPNPAAPDAQNEANGALSADARGFEKPVALPSPETVASWAFAPAPRQTRGVSDQEPPLVAVELAIDKATKRLGLLPSSEKSIAKSPKFKVRATRGTRPARVLLDDLLPPVGDQGTVGSCAGWATAYAMYTHEVNDNLRRPKDTLADPRFQFAPSFIYHMRKNNAVDGGMSIGEAFAILRDKGCAKMSDYPYKNGDFSSRPSAEVQEKAARYKARQIGLLFTGAIRGGPPVDMEKIKTFLAERRQPIVTGISVFTDFETLSNVGPDFVYSPSNPAKENFRGFHAVAIIGYDEDKKAIRLRNSWNTFWGDKGDLWVSEEFIRQLTLEGWSSIAGGPVARGFEKNAIPGNPNNLIPPGEGPIKLPAPVTPSVSLEKGN